MWGSIWMWNVLRGHVNEFHFWESWSKSPLLGCFVQGGLGYFNLKYFLCIHFETISVLELSVSFGLERAIKVFSDKQVPQNLAPGLYVEVFALRFHFISSISMFFPNSFCFQIKLESFVPFWCLYLILPLCSFHLLIKGLLLIPM